MTGLPVIVRELRAEARNPYNYWLRVLTIGLAILVLWVITNSAVGNPKAIGDRLFRGLNGLIFVSIWLLTPILTADCLSREKREGTLGLLFLTPLSAAGIVAAKGVIHAIRALMLALVAVPITALAMLWGGLTWREIVIAGMMNIDVLLLGLSAGVLASAVNRIWVRSVILALLFAFTYVSIFAIATAALFVRLQGGNTEVLLSGPETVFTLCVGANGLGLGTRQLDALLTHVATMSWGAALFAFLILRYAARRVRDGWQDVGLTLQQIRYQRVFCTPRFRRKEFRSRMRASLDRNPIGWLQHYAWSARVAKWGWCALFILIEGMRGLEFSYYDYFEDQIYLLGLLLLGMSLSAAGSFINERRSGAMELILVSPLSVQQIIFGRCQGIWTQFGPAALVMALYLVLTPLTAGRVEIVGGIVFGLPLWLSCLVGPVSAVALTGLYFSLQRKSFMGAWLMTAMVSLGLPLLLAALLIMILGPGMVPTDAYGRYYQGVGVNTYYTNHLAHQIHEGKLRGMVLMAMALQWVLSAMMYRRLRKTLEERSFAVNLT